MPSEIQKGTLDFSCVCAKLCVDGCWSLEFMVQKVTFNLFALSDPENQDREPQSQQYCGLTLDKSLYQVSSWSV